VVERNDREREREENFKGESGGIGYL